jgi:hypothetical protein
MELGARLTGIDQHLRDGVDGHVRNAADRPHGRTFNQHVEDQDALGEWTPVHNHTI